MTAPQSLRIDSGGDQFAVSGPTPRLSWWPVAGADGYELDATLDGVRLPGVSVDAAAHLFCPWPWAPLASRQRVAWRVRSGSGGEWSDWHAFEAGLFDADWTARWISPADSGGQPGRRPAHRLSLAFELPGSVVAARLYATALGVYEAFVNDERAGTAELSPGSTSYDRTLYAQASDVTASLRAGTNRLELLLSDGWYRGQVGAFRIPAGWGDTLAARAELHAELADGTIAVIRTDETWASSASTITRADLMDGQTTDFVVTAGETAAVLVDAVDAPPITWSPAPPIRVVETLAPVAVTRLDAETVVVDFGQNASGWLRLDDLGPAGTRTIIDHGEHVGPDGDLDTHHLDGVRPGEPPVPFVQRDEVVSAGDGASFEPRHTVHGFRYARVRRPGGLAELGPVAMQVVQSDLTPTGTFACSDPDLTRLWEVARWSFRGNAVDVPTDCPTRERLGWTGDYQVFVSTAARMFDVLGFSRKWLASVRDDQLADGRIANFSPDGRRIKQRLGDQLAMMTGSAGWGDAIVHVPWELYRAYGDDGVLAENYDAMVRWCDWALGTAGSARHPSRVQRSAEPLPHERYLWDGSFHWGEWCEPKPRAADGSLVNEIQTNPMAWFMADKGEVGTAYLYRSASELARIADVLGRDADAARWAGVADAVADAWRIEFLGADGRTVGDTQAAYVRALTFGLIPDELRPRASARLVELVEAADWHLTTGFLSTADLLPTLADAGYPDVAYRLLLQRTPPAWRPMLDRGATTIWEDWDGVDEAGAAHESLNHYSKGAVVRFLHSHTLGLTQAEGSVAWEEFVVAPRPGESLTWAHGGLATPQGPLVVEWKVTADQLEIVVEAPPGTTGTLVFPDGHRVSLASCRTTHTRPMSSKSGYTSGHER